MLKDTDHGYKALLAKAFGKFRLDVGIFEKDANEPKEKSESLTVGEVAAFHEFGLGVPERSFLRGWHEENEEKAKEAFRRMAESTIKDSDADAALEKLGQTFVGSIQQRISDHIPPPLADSTIARKGSDVPLVDTGQLRSSITYRVTR